MSTPHPSLNRWNRILQMAAAIMVLAALYGLMRPSAMEVNARTAAEEVVEQAPPLQTTRSVRHVQPQAWRPDARAMAANRPKREGLPEALETILLEENPVEIQAQQLEDIRRDAATADQDDREFYPSQEEIEDIQSQGLIAW